jgi:hypothetical protein
MLAFEDIWLNMLHAVEKANVGSCSSVPYWDIGVALCALISSHVNSVFRSGQVKAGFSRPVNGYGLPQPPVGPRQSEKG